MAAGLACSFSIADTACAYNIAGSASAVGSADEKRRCAHLILGLGDEIQPSEPICDDSAGVERVQFQLVGPGRTEAALAALAARPLMSMRLRRMFSLSG